MRAKHDPKDAGMLMRPVRIIIADDHKLVRAGFRALISGNANMEVVAEAGDGHEALRLAGELGPDIVLVDISMPGMNGLEVAARISRDLPDIRVIIISMHASAEYVIRALKAGARGYLLKDAGTDELEQAIMSVMKKGTFLSPSISGQVIDDHMKKASSEQGRISKPFESLTPRQREVLQLIAEGLTSKDIARKLDLSVKTVEAHRTQIMERLDIHDVAGLVRYAVMTGIISPV